MKNLLLRALDRVNVEYFNFEELPDIIVSKGIQKENRRSIIFGTYHTKKNIIKIHPVLLEESIPEFVLDFVIYHELLHYEDRESLINRKKGDLVHSPQFKKREKAYKYYVDAQKILKNILHGNEISMEKPKERNKKRLSGEALEKALAESLQHLDAVMAKYNLIEEKPKGVRNGAKKKNEQNQLAGNV